MKKRRRKTFDDFSRHEVYDRASVVLDLFCSSVAEHPVIAADKALSAEADKVTDALYSFYNVAAQTLMPSPRKRRGTRKRSAESVKRRR